MNGPMVQTPKVTCPDCGGWKSYRALRCLPCAITAYRASHDPAARFWTKVDRSGGPDACWPWMAARNRSGYGVFQIEGRQESAPRVAWALTNGPIPDGLWIRHTCDNPPCANPAHLLPGTHLDNMRDRSERDRAPKGATHAFRQHPELHARGDRTAGRKYPGLFAGTRNGRARLTEADIPDICNRRADGESCSSIARDYGVNLTTIHRAGSGRSWAHVQPAGRAA